MPEDVRYEQKPFTVPADATEVILVRHGASQSFTPGEEFELVEGHGNPALSQLGERQAEAVGARLADEDLAALFVTTLRRTHQTAAPLVERTGMEPTVIRDLREVHLGEWEGGLLREKWHSNDPLIAQMVEQERWDVIPGAETREAFASRVRAGLDEIVRQAGPGVTVAAFVHGGVIGDLCRQATDSRGFAFIHVDNGSLSRIVVFADGRLLLRSFNEITHLP